MAKIRKDLGRELACFHFTEFSNNNIIILFLTKNSHRLYQTPLTVFETFFLYD